jgi:hypothetical protein
VKYFSALVVLMAAQFAFAAPHVGDQAIYDLSEGTQAAQDERTLLSVDLSSNTCLEQWQMIGENGGASQDTVKCTDIDYSPYTPQHCAQVHGAMKQVTVPAGTFAVCELINQKGEAIDIGNVPFGLVHATLIDDNGATETVQLHSFNSGR